jgi:hypothetical protein
MCQFAGGAGVWYGIEEGGFDGRVLFLQGQARARR